MAISIFNNQEEKVTNNGGSLPASVQLVSLTDSLASNLLEEFKSMDEESANSMISNAFNDANIMAQYLYDYNIIDDTTECQDLNTVNDEDAVKLLKSQQSKQSRSKSSGLTIQNFKKMASATAAIQLIRKQCNLSARSNTSAPTPLRELNEESLQFYSANQNELGKAIRNIQSKKSILKKKLIADGITDVDSDDAMKDLIEYEEALKALRISSSSQPVDPQILKDAGQFALINGILMTRAIDIDKMKKADLIAIIQELKDACGISDIVEDVQETVIEE